MENKNIMLKKLIDRINNGYSSNIDSDASFDQFNDFQIMDAMVILSEDIIKKLDIFISNH